MSQPPPFPTGPKPSTSEVADWAELAALGRRAAFKVGDLKAAIHMEDVDNPELVEQEVWDELQLRGNLMGTNWPLRVVGSRIGRRSGTGVPIDLYRFLCHLGLGGNEPQDRKLFELVVVTVIRALTGREGLHLGAPASEGMDKSFRKRVATYSQVAGLLPQEIKSSPLPDDKDLGLDAVTWLPFRDARGANLHFLVQCATGADWQEKLHDLDLEIWKDHLHWSPAPVRMFAVPFVLTLPEAKWVRTSRRAGLILDRPRLLELAKKVALPPALLTSLRSRVRVLHAA